MIKTITQDLNPRVCRVAALPAPSDRERTQWYFQRYVAELPSGGEMVLFDRSWYNRAGVERVMGFCTEEEYQEFLRACPLFEEMLIRSGIKLKDVMFAHTDTKLSPWWVVQADDKRRARLNTITHLLASIPYEYQAPAPLALPPRQSDEGYERPPLETQRFVPEVF